jgi:hypothetical protein
LLIKKTKPCGKVLRNVLGCDKTSEVDEDKDIAVRFCTQLVLQLRFQYHSGVGSEQEQDFAASHLNSVATTPGAVGQVRNGPEHNGKIFCFVRNDCHWVRAQSTCYERVFVLERIGRGGVSWAVCGRLAHVGISVIGCQPVPIDRWCAFVLDEPDFVAVSSLAPATEST